MNEKQKIVMILGPTATGKTKFGVTLASEFNGEIISADSRQIYRGLDIGTGKDLGDYTVPYHLIDIINPNDEYSLADYLSDATIAIDDIHARGKNPFVVGGTALYLHGLLSGYELHGGAPNLERRQELRACTTEQLCQILAQKSPDSDVLKNEPNNRIRLIRAIELAEGGDPNCAKEPKLPTNREFLIIGVLRPRDEVHKYIELRLKQRIEEQNMLDEARRLHDAGMSYERMEFLGLEYRYMALFLQGKLTQEEMFTQLLAKINQFAKRQDSWYRKMERDGFNIYWISPSNLDAAKSLVSDFLADKPLPPITYRLSEINNGVKK